MDNWGAVCAHIGAVQCQSSDAANHQLIVAVALRDRFPKVAALFADGLIDYRTVRTVVLRAALVVDPNALLALDQALAQALTEWGPMSVDRTEKAIDALIAQVDPHAVRRTKTRARGRYLDVVIDDGSGMATVLGSLFATDAVALDRRLTAMAATVCPADPRTKDQRRADAGGALAAGADRLACLCGTDTCDAAQNPPSSGVIIHVVARSDFITEPGAPNVPAPASDAPADDNASAADTFHTVGTNRADTDEVVAATVNSAADPDPANVSRRPTTRLTAHPAKARPIIQSCPASSEPP